MKIKAANKLGNDLMIVNHYRVLPAMQNWILKSIPVNKKESYFSISLYEKQTLNLLNKKYLVRLARAFHTDNTAIEFFNICIAQYQVELSEVKNTDNTVLKTEPFNFYLTGPIVSLLNRYYQDYFNPISSKEAKAIAVFIIQDIARYYPWSFMVISRIICGRTKSEITSVLKIKQGPTDIGWD